jgi:hypothetical protein
MNRLACHLSTLVQIARLPVALLRFDRHIAPEPIEQAYRYFTKPHPKYLVFQNKSLGAALLDLQALSGRRDVYLDGITGSNLGAHHARRARNRGYVLAEIERNDYIDDIHAINTSVDTRQGQPMAPQYLQKVDRFEAEEHVRYFGVISAEGQLMAYANLTFFGNFCDFSQILGLRNNDGCMHLLVVDIVCNLIDEGVMNYVMYDTFFGARPGLKQFKTMLGFKPYRVKYRLEK